MSTGSKLLLLFLLCASATCAQNALVPIPPTFLGPAAAPRLGANLTITFCTSSATGVPCSPLAQAYADSTNSFPINQNTNPLKTDALGNAPVFYAAPGQYSYTITGPGLATPQGPYQISVSCVPGVSCVTTSANNAFSGNNTFTGQNSINSFSANSIIQVDGVKYTGAQALQSAIQACSGQTNCVVDARNPLIGTQTFTVNPLSGLNMPITIYTGPYTVQWDHAALFVDYPSNFHWIGSGTKVLNSSGSAGAGTSPIPRALGINYFFGSRIYSTTCSTTNGSPTVTVASATNLTVGAMLLCIGASGPNALQATATNGATGTGASFTVNQTTGWDISGTKDNYLQIESEQMVCSGGTGTTFTGCTRGINGTTAVSHANAVTVNAITGFISEILNISGTTLTVSENAGATVTGAQAYSGVSNSSVEGTMIWDGNQTVAGTMRFLHGIAIVLSGNIFVAPGIQYVRWDQGGASLFGSRNNYIYASHYQTNGKSPNALGWDIGVFESSSQNHIISLTHGFGVDAAGVTVSSDIGVFIDDRSANSTTFDGPSNDNVLDLGAMINPTICVSVQSGSSRNYVHLGKCKINPAAAGTGAYVNYDSDWIVNGSATNVTPTGNSIYFSSIDGTGGTALTTIGYTGVGQNLIFGGSVLGGSTGCLTGDYCSYLNSSGQRTLAGNAKEFLLVMARSGGGAAFPDITGDGTHALVLGDANGVRVGSSAFFDHSSGSSVRVNNTNPAVNNAVMQFTTAGVPSFSASPGSLTIASGTAAMTTAAITAGNCGTTVTVSASGVATTDTITWAFNAAPAGSNAGIVAWPTANNVNFAYCSNTAQTPAAATINWRVIR